MREEQRIREAKRSEENRTGRKRKADKVKKEM